MFEKMKDALGVKTVDYAALIKAGAIVVDVRTPDEFKAGQGLNTINIPLLKLKKHIKELKGKEVILVCLSGMRASQGKAILKEHGITAHAAGSWTRFR